MFNLQKIIKESILVLGLLGVTTSFYSCGDDGDDIVKPNPVENSKITLSCPDSNHPHAIDLGLPSKLKWACCNVGAKSRSDCGTYVAWGELYSKSSYDWDNYKWSDYLMTYGGHLTKYCMTSLHGIEDGVQVLLPEDDIATQKWGGRWRMPTVDEQNELVMNCKWKKGVMSGQEGCMIVGPNNNTIFLPMTEVKGNPDFFKRNCCYWSSSLDFSYSAHLMYFDYDDVLKGTTSYSRVAGFCVRPVCP